MQKVITMQLDKMSHFWFGKKYRDLSESNQCFVCTLVNFAYKLHGLDIEITRETSARPEQSEDGIRTGQKRNHSETTR